MSVTSYYCSRFLCMLIRIAGMGCAKVAKQEAAFIVCLFRQSDWLSLSRHFSRSSRISAP